MPCALRSAGEIFWLYFTRLRDGLHRLANSFDVALSAFVTGRALHALVLLKPVPRVRSHLDHPAHHLAPAWDEEVPRHERDACRAFVRKEVD